MADNTPFYLLGLGAQGTVSQTPTTATATNTTAEEEGGGTSQPFNWNGLLSGAGSLLGGVGGLIGGIKGGNTPAADPNASGNSGNSGGNNTPPAQSTNTTTWILGGVLGLVLVGGLIFLIMKK
jgi:hypothetical protein